MISILLNIGLIAAVGFFYIQTKKQKVEIQEPIQLDKRSFSKTYNIAILTPVTHPSLEAIENGFKKTLKKSEKADYTFKTYNANGQRPLMRAQAEEIINGNYDLIYAIASQPAIILKEISTKKQCTTPIVFAAVSQPLTMGLATTLESSGNHLTGVQEGVDYATQLKVLVKLKKNVKNILLPYDPAIPELQEDMLRIQKLATSFNLSVKPLEIFHSNEIYNKLSASLNGIDTILILKDNTLVSGIDSVIKLAQQHHITIMTTDLDSPVKGAAIGFGFEEYDAGVESAQKAQAILEEKKKPSEVPITAINKQRVKINSKTMEPQNLVIDETTMLLLKSTTII